MLTSVLACVYFPERKRAPKGKDEISQKKRTGESSKEGRCARTRTCTKQIENPKTKVEGEGEATGMPFCAPFCRVIRAKKESRRNLAKETAVSNNTHVQKYVRGQASVLHLSARGGVKQI